MRALVTRAWLYGLGILTVCGGIAAGCSSEHGNTGTGAAVDVDAGAVLQDFPDAMGLARSLAARKPELAKTLGDNPAVALRLNAGKLLPAEVEGSAGRAIGFSISERLSGPSTFYA